MASCDSINLQIRLVPSEQTLQTCLQILNVWQEDNKDKFIALVPDGDKYVYELVRMEMKKNEHGKDD